ncbi:MAG TPA: fibrillarin-like rRNA/tRNA 2'-O-methyltransferase [Nautiliaceae bacterium]|nr:fibrillarin-like rRNA/tRNA 2'-O-methyltransferase [Nautiliaceae bacterium]
MEALPYNKNIFREKNKLYTLNLIPGKRVYGEKLIKRDNKEFREWNPRRSKLAAAILKGLRIIPLREDTKVLYLGASTGTTVSHISDIVREGLIFAIEFAPKVARELFFLSKERENIFPILADANFPLSYYPFMTKVDLIFQDIAQPNQVDILVKNIYYYLKPNKFFMIAIKSRSIDVTKKPDLIYFLIKRHIEEYGLKIEQEIKLEPYEKDHIFFIGKFNGKIRRPGSIKWIDIVSKYEKEFKREKRKIKKDNFQKRR